jgi:hypothetical protein
LGVFERGDVGENQADDWTGSAYQELSTKGQVISVFCRIADGSSFLLHNTSAGRSYWRCSPPCRSLCWRNRRDLAARHRKRRLCSRSASLR